MYKLSVLEEYHPTVYEVELSPFCGVINMGSLFRLVTHKWERYVSSWHCTNYSEYKVMSLVIHPRTPRKESPSHLSSYWGYLFFLFVCMCRRVCIWVRMIVCEYVSMCVCVCVCVCVLTVWGLRVFLTLCVLISGGTSKYNFFQSPRSYSGCWWSTEIRQPKFVYYSSRKRELNRKILYECRCDERLNTKTEGSTRLTYTGLCGELEHLKIKPRLKRREVSKCDGRVFNRDTREYGTVEVELDTGRLRKMNSWHWKNRSVSRWSCKNRSHTNSLCTLPDVLEIEGMKDIELVGYFLILSETFCQRQSHLVTYLHH